MSNRTIVIGNKKVKTPVFQGGMGVGISLGRLAGAVAREGGVGIISAAQIGYRDENFEKDTWKANQKAIHEELKKAREIAPDGIIGFNIMVAMNQYEEHVKEAVKAGADIIVSGAGLPVDLPSYVGESNVALAPIISTKKAANVILKYWDRKYQRTADVVIIEGPWAGGHLGFHADEVLSYTRETYAKEVKEILSVVKTYEEKYKKEIYVVLGGGIRTKEDFQYAMSLGVDGVQIGSRFVTTIECDADEKFKMAYVNAKKDDIAIIKSPVGMPGRAIMNSFMEKVKKEGRIPPKKCYHCIHTCDPAKTPYCITKALIHAAKGELDQALLFCGAYAYEAKKLETVKEVIESLEIF